MCERPWKIHVDTVANIATLVGMLNTTGNGFEQAGRWKKVAALLNLVPFAETDDMTQAFAQALADDDLLWRVLMDGAGVKAASAETRRLVVACVRQRRPALAVYGIAGSVR